MDAIIPSAVTESKLSRLLSRHLERMHRGKTCDTYQLPGFSHLLQYRTDRISAFDFVLPCVVPVKGEVLTAMTIFFLKKVLGKTPRHHLIAYGSAIDMFLPTALCGNSNLHANAIVVRRLHMADTECIVRGYLAGSALREYQDRGMVWGAHLKNGLADGSALDEPMFTPTTKADAGHDLPIMARDFERRYGLELKQLSLAIYSRLHAYAGSRGIILADIKFEFGVADGGAGRAYVLGDEVSPDSARFWQAEDRARALKEHRSPKSYDKEFVRAYCNERGMRMLNPSNPEHMKQVHSMQFPDEVLHETTKRYQDIFQQLSCSSLAEFQRVEMGIRR